MPLIPTKVEKFNDIVMTFEVVLLVIFNWDKFSIVRTITTNLVFIREHCDLSFGEDFP